MAKTLLYEGCPACERSDGYGAMALSLPSGEVVKSMIQGGAIGAGAATAIDFVLPKIPFLNRLPVTIRPVINGGLSVLAATLLYKRNPSLAVGIGLGGSSVAIYKFIASLVGKVATVPSAGMGVIEANEESYYGEEPVSIETTAGEIGEQGVIVPIEEMSGYGQEEIIVE